MHVDPSGALIARKGLHVFQANVTAASARWEAFSMVTIVALSSRSQHGVLATLCAIGIL
jgi:hypothetical protein